MTDETVIDSTTSETETVDQSTTIEQDDQETVDTESSTETETTIPDAIATDDVDDEDSEYGYVQDVAKLIQEGDAEKALQRLSEFSKGIDKLKSKPEQVRTEVLGEISAFYDEVASGNPEAIEALETQILAKKGTSIKGLYAASIGLTTDELDALIDGDELPKRTAVPDQRVDALAKEVEALKAEKLEAKWAAEYGGSIQKYLLDATGLNVPVEVIAKARHLLPKRATATDIEEAVMQVNPRAYRAALAAKGAPQTPASALISKGGKGSSIPSAAELLRDPAKMEAYLRS